MQTLRMLFSNGWFQVSFMVFILWGIHNVVFRVNAAVLDVNFFIFTCCLFLSCSFTLLMAVGKGGLGQETMRSLDTWAYGIILLMFYILNLYLFGLVTSTEATLLQRLSIVVSLIVGWFFLGRKANGVQWMGALTVLLGVLFICAGVAEEIKEVLYAVVIISGFLQAAQIFVAEFHRPHRQAAEIQQSPRARCRVVGFVMFVTSLLFLVLVFLLALTQGIHAEENMIMADLPVLKDFLHTETILSGLITGVLLVAPTKVLEFSSAHKINAHNFLAVCCLAPAATLFWEWATSPMTGLSLRAFTTQDLLVGVAITVGGLVAAFGGVKERKGQHRYEKYLKYTAQELDKVEDSREIVAGTLEHFESDIKQAAKALGVPEFIIHAVLTDEDKVLAFRNLENVSRRYRHHVANRDGLTGLLNRSGFMMGLKKALTENKRGVLFYIDLDKFKPVNDTFGHDTGDAVLAKTAERLRTTLPASSIAARMGGDEFCAYVPGADKTKGVTLGKQLKAELSRGYKVKGVRKTIKVGASIGQAYYPADATTPTDLISAADKGMYGVKHSVT